MDYEEAKRLINKPSFILEDPVIINQCINQIREHDGEEGVAQMGQSLADNYDGSVNLLYDMANWMHDLGEDQLSIQSRIEEAVNEVIFQNYDKSITTELSLTSGLEVIVEWCDQLVEYPSWRQTFYKLAHQTGNEDCPLLTFALTCIALKQECVPELVSVPSSWHTLETLLKCLNYVLQVLLVGGKTAQEGNSHEEQDGDSESMTYEEAMKHFLNMGCYSEHTYLIVQSVLYCLTQKNSAKSHISKHFSRLLEEEADNRGHDVSKYSVHFCSARDYQDAMVAMKSILYKKQLNQADITQLYTAYKDEVSPPVELLRLPVFIDLLANALFVSGGVHISHETQEQYIYLYSYASSVVEEMIEEKRNYCDRSKLNETIDLVADSSKICRQWYNMVGSGISHRAFCDMPRLLSSLECRPVSYGVFQFVKEIFTAKRNDFELNLDTMMPYTIVVNELASCNQELHGHILSLICSLLTGSMDGLEDLSQVEYKKMLIDLLIHLITCAMVEPVILKMKSLFEKDMIDTSIVRYFVTELLDLCDSPYSQSFMSAMLPLVDHPDILAGLKKGAQELTCRSFIEYCSFHMKQCET